jgi:hypothetical protein
LAVPAAVPNPDSFVLNVPSLADA